MESITLTRKERIWLEKEGKSSARRRKIQRYAVIGTATAGIMLSAYSGKTYACACNDIYTVQKGDTLFALAKKYNVSVEQIQNANGISSDMIYAGQKLEVPFPVKSQPDQGQQQPKAPAQTRTGQTTTHNVQPGDSLSLLANKYGTSIEQIKKDNGLSSDLIRVGQALVISGANAPASAPVKETPKTSTDSASAAVYTVAAGDTLWGISQRFHLSTSDIKLHNNMTSDMVYIGQKLVIKSNNLVNTTAVVVGAADNFTVEFETEKGALILQVAYGTGQNYADLSGKKVELVYASGERPALITYQLAK